jgi:hypothetical protein
MSIEEKLISLQASMGHGPEEKFLFWSPIRDMRFRPSVFNYQHMAAT